MRIFLVGCGLLLALGIAVACFAGVVVIAVSMDQAIQAPVIQPSVPDATPSVPAIPEPGCSCGCGCGKDCPCKEGKAHCKSPTCKCKKNKWGADGCQSVGLASGFEQRGGGSLVHDGPVHSGQEVQIDIPADLLKRNIASKGLGCCVFRSANYIGIFNNIASLIDLPERMKEAGVPGGGYPEKFDEVMKRFAPDFKYIQVTNGDWNIVKLALKTGRCVAITFQPAHMVNLVRLDGTGTFRDNNLTGPSELIWGTEEAIKAKAGGAHFWAVIPLHGRPPAPPKAGKQSLGFSEHRVRVPLSNRLAPERLPGRYSWDEVIDDEQWILYRDGRQIGAFVPDWDCYQERLAPGQWKTWRRPPVSLPDDAMAKLENMPPGVQIESLGQRECYSLCGQEISREQAMAALEDDSNKLSLTVIGSKTETARVRADLERPEMVALKSRVVFQEYEPTNWAVDTKRYGFDTTGHPSVYLQQPDGTVLYHTNQYEGVPVLTALRKADPNYKPDTDPGMPNSPTPLESDWGPLPLLALMGGGGTFLLSLLGGAGALLHALYELLNPAPAVAADAETE